MDDFQEFAQHGYEIQQELGNNRAGGRVTYLARDTQQQRQVVIKQFQFAQSQSSWGEYDAYQREIQVLRGLNHPGIARYLNSFQTANGFCMVQEYKKACSLGMLRSYSTPEIVQIATALLQILVYLQNRIPPVIHRDVKPENILVDDQLNVYLVDFGFARIGDGELGVSSVVKGTLGFMPPEQMFNRQLTEASDLYGLGVTLICLLTRTKSKDVGNLIDTTYRVNFKHLVPKLSIDWVKWLETMVAPSLTERFANAVTALAALPQHAMLLPEARLSCTKLNLQAKRLGEVLTHSITVHNPVPDTMLEGVWEVAPHPSDPPHDPASHAWITFDPVEFQGNHLQCQIIVHSDRLIANKTYQRQVILRTKTPTQTIQALNGQGLPHLKLRQLKNTPSYAQTIDLQVQTAQVYLKPKRATLLPLGLLSGFSVASTWLIANFALTTGALLMDSYTTGLSAAAGVAIGFEAVACLISITGATTGATAGAIGGIVVGVLAFLAIAFTPTTPVSSAVILTGIGFGSMGGMALGGAIGLVVEQIRRHRVSQETAILMSLLTAALGVSVGLGLSFGFLNPVVLLTITTTGLPLGLVISCILLHRLKLLNQHRQMSQHLIRP
jgi:serine/threonine protein kinase